MANKILIQGEQGLRGPIQIKSELIVDPITQALNDYKKQEAIRDKQTAAIRNSALKQVTNNQGKVSVKITDPNLAALGFNEFQKHKNNIASDYLNQQYQYNADRFSADFNTAIDNLNSDKEAYNANRDGRKNGKPYYSEGSSVNTLALNEQVHGQTYRNVRWNPDTRSNEFEVDQDGDGTYEYVSQNDLDKNVVLFNSKLKDIVVDDLKNIQTAGLNGNNVLRDNQNNIRTTTDYNDLLDNTNDIVSFAWDPYAPNEPSFVKSYSTKNPKDPMNWANIDHEDFDEMRLKREAINYYNDIRNKEYNAGLAMNKGDNTRGGRIDADISKMVENSYDGSNNTFDLSTMRTATVRISDGDLSDDPDENGMYSVEVYSNGEWINREYYPKNMDPEKLKRIFKMEFGAKVTNQE
tara:strand:+ start:44 stop:1267 length:1224 start_codon:yes stop_codon:yes gene_type:complete